MKKSIVTLSGIIMALLLAFSGSIFGVKVYAADKASGYLKDAKFIDALKGSAKDESDLVIALYEKKDTNLIFFDDGFSKGYSTFTKKDVYTKDHGLVEKITIDEGFQFSYYEEDGVPYLLSEDGIVYTCKHLTAADVLNLISEE